MKFRSMLTERYINVFDTTEKNKYKQLVFDLLTESYKTIGGLKGSGFETPSHMVESIPFWKLAFSNKHLVACVMYKESNGRKLVALGSTGTPAARRYISMILNEEFKRSYAEISGPLLKYMTNKLPEILHKFRIPSAQVQPIINKRIDPKGKYTYTRTIGGSAHLKVLLGSPGKTITAP